MTRALTVTFSRKSYATRLALAFILWSAIWVVLSDYLVALLSHDYHVILRLQTEKGLAYVVISGALLWLVVQALERDEATLRAANEHRLRLLKESGLIAVAGWNVDGSLSYGNQAFLEMVGYPPEELRQKPGRDLVPPDSLDAVLQSEQELVDSGRSALYRCEILRKDGTRVPVIGGQAFVGETLERISYFIDISRLVRSEEERLKLQEQLLHSEKVNALGQFAGGVAHNFNNELSIIVGYCTLLKDQFEPGSSGLRSLELVLAAAERARRLIQQLLTFSRKQKAHSEVVDLNVVIREIEPVIRQLLSSAIEITVTLSDQAEFVDLDRTQFEQLLLNLTANARDAMSDGGRLVIALAHEDPNQDIPAEGACGYVVVKVADNGGGMDDATRARIFEPFFTTKSSTGGTGLGLSTVFGIVTQNKGDIAVESVLGSGTTFTVRFPKVAGAGVLPEREAPPVRARAVKASILLVEDNHDLRELLKYVLESDGMAVIAARDGAEAVEFASLAALPLDLVLSDVAMPRLNGPDAIRQIRKLRPQVKVLFVSGSADQVEVESPDVVLWKPVTPTALLEAVHAALALPAIPGDASHQAA